MLDERLKEISTSVNVQIRPWLLPEVMVFEATYLVAALTPGHLSACCGQYGAQISKVLRPDNASQNIVGIGRDPPAICEATTGIFLWSAGGLYDTISTNVQRAQMV